MSWSRGQAKWVRRRRSVVSLQELETKVRKVFTEGILLLLKAPVKTLCKMGNDPAVWIAYSLKAQAGAFSVIVKTSRTFVCSSSGKPHDSELLWTILTTSFHQAYQPLIKITGIRTCSGTSISSFHSRPLCRVGLGTNIGRIKVSRRQSWTLSTLYPDSYTTLSVLVSKQHYLCPNSKCIFLDKTWTRLQLFFVLLLSWHILKLCLMF